MLIFHTQTVYSLYVLYVEKEKNEKESRNDGAVNALAQALTCICIRKAPEFYAMHYTKKEQEVKRPAHRLLFISFFFWVCLFCAESVFCVFLCACDVRSRRTHEDHKKPVLASALH